MLLLRFRVLIIDDAWVGDDAGFHHFHYYWCSAHCRHFDEVYYMKIEPRYRHSYRRRHAVVNVNAGCLLSLVTSAIPFHLSHGQKIS